MLPTLLLTGSEGYIATNFYENYKKVFNFIKLDTKINKPILEFNDFQSVQYIVHMGGNSGIAECDGHIDMSYINNVLSTLHLLRGIPIVIASSQAAKNPKSGVYASTKRMCEVGGLYHNLDKNCVKLLRFANVYGGTNFIGNKTSVVAQFLTNKLNNEPLQISGDGSQTRDFVHVIDVCSAIFLSLICNKRFVDPVDVGTGRETSINKIASMISDNIQYSGKNSGAGSSVADTSQLEKLTGFVPQNRIEEYLV